MEIITIFQFSDVQLLMLNLGRFRSPTSSGGGGLPPCVFMVAMEDRECPSGSLRYIANLKYKSIFKK